MCKKRLVLLFFSFPIENGWAADGSSGRSPGAVQGAAKTDSSSPLPSPVEDDKFSARSVNPSSAVPNKETPEKGKSSSQIKTKASDVDVEIYGKMRAEATAGNNSTKYHVLFDGEGQILNFTNLYKSGTRIYTNTANVWGNVNSSEFGVKASRGIGGWVVSAVLNLTADGNADRSVREAYVEVASPWATLVLGNAKGNEVRSSCGPHNFAYGSGGTNGNFFSRFCNRTTLVSMDPIMVGSTANATKFMVFFKRVQGWQLSLSYAPSSVNAGEGRMNTARKAGEPLTGTFDLASFSQALNYLWESGPLKVNLSCIHISGNTKPELPNQGLLQRFNTNSWEVGGEVGYGPVRLGCEFIYNGKGGYLRNPLLGVHPTLIENNQEVNLVPKCYLPSLAGKFYTINSGVAYLGKGWGASFTCLYTSRNTGFLASNQKKAAKAKGLGIVVSVEWEVCDGVMPYIEFANYRLRNPDWAYIGSASSTLTRMPFVAVPSNTASGALAGLKVQF